MVDPNKIRRGKVKVLRDATVQKEVKTTEENIICILYDGRKDLTNIRLVPDKQGKLHPKIVEGGTGSVKYKGLS